MTDQATPANVRLTDGLGALVERLCAYVNAAHWWAEAHDNELAEAGDTRFEARARMLDAEAALMAAGYVFERA